MAEPVDRGCVDPVDAQLKGPVNCRDGIIVLLRSPGILPARAADGPCPAAQAGDGKIGIPEHSRLHVSLPLTTPYEARVTAKNEPARLKNANGHPFIGFLNSDAAQTPLDSKMGNT